MAFKLIIVCAALAAVSCTRLDNENRQNQKIQLEQQQEMIREQNEMIRDHQRVESQQQKDQLRDLAEQTRRQEEINRNNEQRSRNNFDNRSHGNIIFATRPQFVQVPVQYVPVTLAQPRYDYNDNVNYNFAYSVSDSNTGDHKTQRETRNGDQVQGQYTMMDSDGFKRIVDYRADDQQGFDATVRREPFNQRFVRVDESRVYAPEFFRYRQPVVQVVSTRPAAYSSTKVSRTDGDKRTEYSTSVTSN